jgi:polysaccharide export outer membrane protein
MVLSLNSMTWRLFRAVLALLAVGSMVTLSACAGTRGGPVEYNVENFGRADTPQALTLEEDYKIAPMDTLKVTVFQVADLSGEYEVDLTGHVALPLLGNVKAVDLTTAELDQRLTQQLGAKYLQSPDVSVGITKSTRRNVTVDGAVRQPGVFPITGPMTLVQVIALARGTDDSANPRRVAIFRQIQGKRMAAAFDLTSIRRGQMEDPQVYSGDIVVVDGSNVRAIQREILTALPILGLFNPFLQ